MYIKLQKKYGGMWIATSRDTKKVYASAKRVEGLFESLKRKKVSPQKTVIGFVEKYGQVSAYISLSVQKDRVR